VVIRGLAGVGSCNWPEALRGGALTGVPRLCQKKADPMQSRHELKEGGTELGERGELLGFLLGHKPYPRGNFGLEASRTGPLGGACTFTAVSQRQRKL